MNKLCFNKFNIGFCTKKDCRFNHTSETHDIAQNIFKNYNYYYELENKYKLLEEMYDSQIIENNLLNKQVDELNKLIKINNEQKYQIEDELSNKINSIIYLKKKLLNKNIELIKIKEYNKKNINENNILLNKIEEQHQYILNIIDYYNTLGIFHENNYIYIKTYYDDQLNDLLTFINTTNLEDKEKCIFLKIENEKLRILIDEKYNNQEELNYNILETSYSILQDKYNNLYEKMTEVNIILNIDKKILMLKEVLKEINIEHHKKINAIITKYNQIKLNIQLMTSCINNIKTIQNNKFITVINELLYFF
jgi:hypothetical protein